MPVEMESRHPRPWPPRSTAGIKDARLANMAKCDAVDIKSLDREFSGSDLYVSITLVRGKVIEAPIPVINGMPFLTGVGADVCFDKIVETLGLK